MMYAAPVAFIFKHWRGFALLAFFAAVVAAQLYLRHKWVNEGRDEYRGKLEQCESTAEVLSDAARAQNEANRKRLAEAEKEKAKAAKAEAIANQAAERLVGQIARINKDLTEARKDPACRDLLETKTCVYLR